MMRLVYAIFFIVFTSFFIACGSSETKTIADIPESFIDGVVDLGHGYDALAHLDVKILTVVNNEEELNDLILKYFLVAEPKKNMFDNIDFSKNTILFAYQMVGISENLSYITIKKIEYDVKKHVHLDIYRYSGNNHPNAPSMTSITGMYHFYSIPKTQTKDITYDVLELKNLDPNYGFN